MTEPFALLIIDPRFLRPLPQSRWNAVCSHCGEPQSRWELGLLGRETHEVCSLCFLYESQWAEKRVDQVHLLVGEMEKEAGQLWLRAADGDSLLQCKDANIVLSAIALVSAQVKAEMDAAAQAATQDAARPSEDSTKPVEVP